jgi:hypothetical protein
MSHQWRGGLAGCCTAAPTPATASPDIIALQHCQAPALANRNNQGATELPIGQQEAIVQVEPLVPWKLPCSCGITISQTISRAATSLVKHQMFSAIFRCRQEQLSSCFDYCMCLGTAAAEQARVQLSKSSSTLKARTCRRQRKCRAAQQTSLGAGCSTHGVEAAHFSPCKGKQTTRCITSCNTMAKLLHVMLIT